MKRNICLLLLTVAASMILVLSISAVVSIGRTLFYPVRVGQVWMVDYTKGNPFKTFAMTNVVLAVSNGYVLYETTYNDGFKCTHSESRFKFIETYSRVD